MFPEFIESIVLTNGGNCIDFSDFILKDVGRIRVQDMPDLHPRAGPHDVS